MTDHPPPTPVDDTGALLKQFQTAILPQLQPIDAASLAALRSESDAHLGAPSTSPLLYLTHPATQRLRRPITLTLPCVANPQEEEKKKMMKKKKMAGQGEESESAPRPHILPPLHSAAAPWERVALRGVR